MALATERLISLRREKILPDGFLDGLGQAWSADPSGQAALDYCDQSGGAVGHVFKAGIAWRNHGYEAVSRAMVAFCDLEWDDACLQFHKTERAVRTASLTQVRQPIYKSSVQLWKRYEAELAPLIAALES